MSRTLPVLSLIVLLGGCVGTSEPLVPGPDDAPVQASLPSYLHDLSPIIPGVTLQGATEYHYRIPMSDGIDLDSWVVVPSGVTGPVPLVLEITPYYGGGSIKECKIVPGVTESVACLSNQINNLLTRGYALGFVSVRGTGSSEGCFTQGGPQEAKDSAAAIEFLADQSWSNGNVATIGISYVGTTQNDLWVESPPSLKTIVTMAGITEMYKYNFVNGMHINPQGYSFNFYYWPVVGLSPAGIEGGTNTDPTTIPGSYAGEACTDQADVQTGGGGSAASGDYSGYWQVRNFSAEFLQEPSKPRASVLYEMGLGDWNVKPHNIEPWYTHLKESGVPLFTLLGNQSHLWPLREDWSHEILVAWLDHFLKGVDTGILDAPPVWLEDDHGVWRAEQAWPPRDAETVRFYLGEGGSLVSEEPGSESRYSYRTSPSGLDVGDVPAASTEFIDVLRSEPLDEALHLSHMGTFHVEAQADGARANFAATLGVEAEDGSVRTINWALQSLNHLGEPTKGRADITGQRLSGDIAFFPQEDVVLAGERLLLFLSSDPVLADGGGPSMTPFPSGAAVTVFGKASYFDLVLDPTITPEEPQPKMLLLPKA